MMHKFRSFVSYINSIGLYNTLNYIFQRYVTRKNLLSVNVKGISIKIYLRRNSTDVNVFQQLFIKKDLSFLKGKDIEVIIDAGANIGLATIYMKNLFPNARVFAIEPETDNFNMLIKNTGRYNNVTTIRKALSEDNRGLYLVDTGRGFDAFQTKKNHGDQDLSHKIKSISVHDIMQQYSLDKLDFVKIDIEGAEAYCINDNATRWIASTKCLAVEIHEHLVPGVEKSIRNVLKDFTFSQHGEYSVFENVGMAHMRIKE